MTFGGPDAGAGIEPALLTAITDANGQAEVEVTANGTVGSYVVSASMDAPPSSVQFVLTNLRAGSTTSLTSSPNPSKYGQEVTFAATVSGAHGTPTGTVTFYEQLPEGILESSIESSNVAPLTDGTAVFKTTALSVGSHNIVAEYSGDATYDGSTSSAVAQVVNPAGTDTTTSLTSSPNPSNYGKRVTFVATVTSADPAITPPGTVTLYEQFPEGVQAVGKDMMEAPGEAGAEGESPEAPGAPGVLTVSFVVSSLSGGQHSMVALYNGDALTNSSTSNTVVQTVRQAPVIIAQPVDQTVNQGETVTFAAEATGYPVPTVRWQVSTNGGGTWANLAGATQTTLSFTATVSQNGYQYRAVFTNASGTATTTAATLTVGLAADLSVNLATGARPSDTRITYTSFVVNAGPLTAEQVTWQDSLPAGTTMVSATATQGRCKTSRDGVVTCTIGTLTSGASARVTLIVGRTDFTIPIVNTATVSSSTFDPDTSNNSATVTVPRP